MFELMTIVCATAALMQGGCIPSALNTQGEVRLEVSQSYEQMIGPGTFQLSYSGSGREFNPAALAAHWNQRAAHLCSGEFIGHPETQTQYPQSLFDATFLSGNLGHSIEAYGVARCVDRNG